MQVGSFSTIKWAHFQLTKTRGEPIPAGKKSLAYALTFQAPDKTLRDAIVAKQVKRIVKRLQQELGAEQRS